MQSQNAAYHVLIYLDPKGQRNLLCDSWTSPRGIASFHLDESIDEFLRGPLWTGLTPACLEKKQAVFPILQRLMKVQKSRRF